MLHAVIMAGGAGTRFWPASRKATPKQLLNLAGSRTMIQMTVDRIEALVPADRVMIVTNRSLVGPIAEQLPQLPGRAILGEPCKRDTAPCIGLAALAVLRNDPEAIMAVMPADHVIRTDEAFQEAIRQAAALVESSPDRIVTFGIRPTYPAETYGYIQRGKPLSSQSKSDSRAYEVKRFREKPDGATAKQYVESGDYYWNAGIFLWHAQTILDELAQRQPKMVEHLGRIAEAWDSDDFQKVLDHEFTAIEGTSIDYAVMEHAEDVVVVEAPFEWDDVGSWQSLTRLRGEDEAGNTILGRHLGLDTRGTIVRTSDDHLVVTLGLEDCIVVHTPDATLVANKHDEESIRSLVKLMQERGWEEYL